MLNNGHITFELGLVEKGVMHMSEKEVMLTAQGLKDMENELENLKSVRRREVAARIKQAIEFGDISENSEYEDAKNEQAFIEGRIVQVEKMLRNVTIIDENKGDDEHVTIGSKVIIKDVETGDSMDYTIVGSAEANPSKKKISNESPVGRAIIGKKVGTTVEVSVPVGVVLYEIVEIAR